VAAENGFYRVSTTATATTTGTASNSIQLATGDNTISYTGDGTSGIFVWGAQLELGSVATDYQRITDVNTEVIERFPNATLYQDTAGTTPVTTTGQSVGLLLDKSKGLVLGPELVTNGTFDSGTAGWSAANSATIAVTSGVAQVTQTSSNLAAIRQSITTAVGRSYRVSCAIASQNGAGIVAIAQDTGTFAVIAQSAVVSSADQTTVTLTFVATATTTFVAARFNASGASGNTFTVDNISVKEIAGNHAVQATTANRPIYGVHPVGGRRNLLVRTEEFENASWSKLTSTVTANAAVAPDGTTTADKLIGTVASTNIRLLQNQPLAGGTTYTYSVYAKSAEYTTLRVQRNDTNLNVFTHEFDLSAGTASGGGVISNEGGGWFRCSGSIVCNATATTGPLFVAEPGTIGNGTSGILIWGAQLEAGSTATAYQRVTDQYNVTEAGVSSVSYLFFDGVNDSLATPTITPGVDKAQVFAGVRKLSDAAGGVLIEHSASFAVNNGTFNIEAPSSATPNYRFNSKGTTLGQVSVSPFVAPISNVLTGLGDISGDLSALRVNAVQAGQSTTDQGTGNYLAYPLFIGARNSASNFFSGHLYSLIARFGPNLDTGQISSTETWVAGKTGITI
jgi:hypothetical protein